MVLKKPVTCSRFLKGNKVQLDELDELKLYLGQRSSMCPGARLKTFSGPPVSSQILKLECQNQKSPASHVNHPLGANPKNPGRRQSDFIMVTNG